MRIDPTRLPSGMALLREAVRELAGELEAREQVIAEQAARLERRKRARAAAPAPRPAQAAAVRPPLRAPGPRPAAARPQGRRAGGGRGRGRRGGGGAGAGTPGARAEKPRRNRGALPRHLPRIEVVVDVETKACPCCGGALHVIGEDVAEMLDVVPAQYRVKVIRRPRYGCRACVGAVVQAPAPERPIDGGMASEALIAQVLVAKYSDHLPLCRQAQIFARHGIELDRSTLADWVGRACRWLQPLYERLLERPLAHLAGFTGVLQVDAGACPRVGLRPDPGAGFNRLLERRRAGPVELAYCWAHSRRRFYEIHRSTRSPIAGETLRRIAELYAIEEQIRGRSAEQRRAAREDQSRPLVDALHAWLGQQLARVSAKSPLAEAIRYTLRHWRGLVRFLDDGRIALDTNTVGRTIRPIALGRRNSLFAGSDGGARHWAVLASLIQTCKLNEVEPFAYLKDVLERLVAGTITTTDLDALLPWGWQPVEPGRP